MISQKPCTSELFVTAVIDACTVTISGRCDILAAFAQQVPSTVTVHATSMDALYHAPVLGDVKASVLSDIARRSICVPDFDDLKAPIVCTVTGERICADSSKERRLIDILLDLILIQPVHWDKVTQVMIDGVQGARLRIINIGPGVGLSKRMARALLQSRPEIIDTLAVDDTASSATAQEPIAIVGMAVNMPGSPDVSRLWEVRVLRIFV